MFNKHLDILFSDIDIPFLRRYETWLRKQGLAENTIGIRFRTLRAVYNLAIEQNLVKTENYPFKKYKVSHLQEETVKRSLSKQDPCCLLQHHWIRIHAHHRQVPKSKHAHPLRTAQSSQYYS